MSPMTYTRNEAPIVTSTMATECVNATCIELRDYLQTEINAKSDENHVLRKENAALLRKCETTKKLYIQFKDLYLEMKIRYDSHMEECVQPVDEENGCDVKLDLSSLSHDEPSINVESDGENVSEFLSEQSNCSSSFQESGFESDTQNTYVDMTEERSVASIVEMPAIQLIGHGDETAIDLTPPVVVNSRLRRPGTMKCYKCFQIFTNQVQLEQHRMQKCGQLQKNRSRSNNTAPLARPKRKRSDAADTPYICQQDGCGKPLGSKSSLKLHMQIHSGIKPFECLHPKCGKRFTYKHYLVGHIRVHSGEKPFACTFAGCDKRYSQKTPLTVHMNVHYGVKACGRCRRSDANECCDDGRDNGGIKCGSSDTNNDANNDENRPSTCQRNGRKSKSA